MPKSDAHLSFWTSDIESLLNTLTSQKIGLTQAVASERLRKLRVTKLRHNHKTLWLLLGQFKSPITLILIFAAFLSFFLHDRTDELAILDIVGRILNIQALNEAIIECHALGFRADTRLTFDTEQCQKMYSQTGHSEGFPGDSSRWALLACWSSW